MNSEFLEKYKELVKKNLLVLALGLVGMILFGYGLISLLLASKGSGEDIVFEANEDNSGNTSDSVKREKITVDIEGGVVNPGVYHLPFNSRIQDAISISGGLSDSADREFIAKNINLAVKLPDGAKIYIPKIGEATTNTTVMGAFSTLDIFETKININSASEQELDSLPGIGPVTSQKILNGRPYSSIDELLSKKIVGEKVFGQIMGKIGVY